MIDILSEFSSEYRTFNLNKINIEDEGMEDLEKFNQMYQIDNSKCSLFDEIRNVSYNITSYSNIESKLSKYEKENNYVSNKKFLFRIDLYIKRIIQNMKKPQIKSLILELGTLSSNNYLILAKIKSIKSNWPKDKLVEMAINIIFGIIIKEE